MKTGSKILLLGGAAMLGGIAWYGYSYKKAAENLKINFGTLIPQGFKNDLLQVRILVKVLNESGFTFLVPRAVVYLYTNGKFIGTAHTTGWQKIPPRGEYILELFGNIEMQNAGDLATAFLLNETALPSAIDYKGSVFFGKYKMDFQSSYAISGNKINPVANSSFGEVFDQFAGNPVGAGRFLLYNGSGIAIDVFHNKDFGCIDLPYGNRNEGLFKIYKKHFIEQDDFDSIESAMKIIADVISNATPKKSFDDTVFQKDGYRVVVRKSEDLNEHYILTSFDESRPQKDKRRKTL